MNSSPVFSAGLVLVPGSHRIGTRVFNESALHIHYGCRPTMRYIDLPLSIGHADLYLQFTDPQYSIIKTTTTDLLDRMAGSPHRTVREVGRVLSSHIPNEWGNWFS